MGDAVFSAPAEAHRYPCEQCGADLRFAPGATSLVCDYCGHDQKVAAPGRDKLAALAEISYNRGIQDRLPNALIEETRVLSCSNCAAQVEFDPAVHASECPFCATPVVTDTGLHRHIKPQGVIPFKLSEDQARDALSRWLGRLWFAPNGVKEYARKGRKMQGIYTPFWTFDADTRSRYSGARGDYYYETKTVYVMVDGRRERRNQRVRKVRWTPVSGRVRRHFDDVVVLASTSLPRGYVDSLEPWDLSQLTAYQPDFLAGFRAEGYTIALRDGHDIARIKMDRVIREDVRRDIGGDQQRIGSVSTNMSNETFKHILLPLWLAAYKFRGKSYQFMVNGQTGEVQGERPWSIMKIAIAIVLVLALLGGVFYISELQQ